MTLLTAREAAEELGITPKAIHKLVERGILSASKFGESPTAPLMFESADVAAAQNRRKPGRPPKAVAVRQNGQKSKE